MWFGFLVDKCGLGWDAGVCRLSGFLGWSDFLYSLIFPGVDFVSFWCILVGGRDSDGSFFCFFF